MKKHLLSFITIFLCLPAIAQITVTHENLVGAGATVILGLDTISQLTPGGGGANQTWDFSSVVIQDRDTMWFMNPNQTPFSGAFPTANLAIRIFLEDMYAYLENTAQGLYVIGTAWNENFGQPNVVSTIVPGETVAAFPMNYLDSYSESFVQEIKAATPEPLSMDSIWIKIYTEKTSVIDAWGAITTPMGTFQTLREHNNTSTIDSIFAYMLGGWTLVEVENEIDEDYSWWSDDPGTGYPVLELNVDTGTGLPDDIFFLIQEPVYGVDEPLPVNSASVIYPNPCEATAWLRLTINDQRLTIVDLCQISGKRMKRLVNKVMLPGTHEIAVDVSDLPAGIYLLGLQVGNESFVKKLVKLEH